MNFDNERKTLLPLRNVKIMNIGGRPVIVPELSERENRYERADTINLALRHLGIDLTWPFVARWKPFLRW
jgi:hypothetical protein